MKFKFMNARVAAITLGLMIIDAGTSQAATVVLNGASNNSCNYTSFSANSSGEISITCATNPNNSTPPTVVPICNPTASVNPISAGAATTLQANCSDAPTGTTYAWDTNPSSGFTSSGSSVAVNPSVATTYSVIATNIVGPSIAKEVTVTISTVNPPPVQPPPIGLLTKAQWVGAFSTLNDIPPSRSTVAYLFEYFKVLYNQKPFGFKLPNNTIFTSD
ncbi:MAG: hypothetical protein M3P47_00605 [Pseudomonadota bacterium]|nr:hypothetical protein [Pseudomonadota bacterium]